jgi:uracil-DNA glycosylase
MDDVTALRLQLEWGADEVLEMDPVNRLRTPTHHLAQAARKSGFSAPSPTQPGKAGEEVHGTPAERATQVAAGACTLEELRDAVAGFGGCMLRDTASNLVFAEGDPSCGLLLIGDAPGPDDDRSGVPFAGAPGGYLDRMLGSIGLERSRLLLTPLIPWRPPGDRPPNQAELAICLPFLFRLIAIAAPRRLVLIGPLAARALLGQTGSRRRPRGAWLDAAIPGLPQPLPALPTFGPAELMRNQRDRQAAWADLRLLRRTLDADVAKK